MSTSAFPCALDCAPRASSRERGVLLRGIAVLQARTNSARLPGKVLLPIHGVPVAVLAAKRAANTGRTVIVATSAASSDDGLASHLQSEGIRCFRGSLDDTLDRVVSALSEFDDRTVVFRLTADNVFPDGTLLDEIEKEFLEKKLDYLACNGEPSGLPFGMSAEITRLGHLREAARESALPYDREHVTPYVIRKFGRRAFQKHKALNKGHLRSTIDFLDDYLLVQKVFADVDDPVHASAIQLVDRLEKLSASTPNSTASKEDKPMSTGAQIFSLQGKTALVTGATGHLGSAMASALAAAGAHVLVNSRFQDRSEALVSHLVALGYSAEPAVFDIQDRDAIDRIFAGYGPRQLDVLINNAYAGGAGSIELSEPEAYSATYGVTMLAAHNLLKAALPGLRIAVKNNGDASVINLTTMYAMVSPDQRIYDTPQAINPPFYAAAKAALLQWTRYAACEFGPEGIRVNSISPGPFPSESVQKSNRAFVDRLSNKVPMGRIGRADEIRGPTLFLASSASSFVNGANIVVDGGWTCW
jgi:NAD(P)-dependent dehydrogenase (short-subunit alcohol dehydrogenase family)/spore coat polysaccharide biosynthesis protein SpsF (cytidylyltransferase family)